MEIRKPIFIVGSGRSGTTILYNLLALHPQVCWFSNLTDRYPQIPQLAVVHRLLDVPGVGDWMKHRLVQRQSPSLRPSEAASIYHKHCNFPNERKMTADELSAGTEDRFKALVRAHLKATGRPRFMSKQTANTQRLDAIDRMFPDAYYVHLIRDGRAVANSLCRVSWWSDVDVWWLGAKPAKWESQGKDAIELCALHWQRDVQEVLAHKPVFGDRYLEIRYENLVLDPRGVLGRVVDFTELSSSTAFNATLPTSLPDMNRKWEAQLDERQIRIVEETIGPLLSDLGYAG